MYNLQIMTYADIARLLVTLTSFLLTYGLWAQVVKTWKTRSAKDFAAPTVISWLLAEIAWLNYGIAIREYPMILLGISNLPAAILAVIGYFKFRSPHSTTQP